ncbi:hypothetical protein BJV78DRAFT_618896 [Lactifluus subvellereus]|nr:hypothetical protein BJV78DRAFT_618896 [Lactifluus subvellereus]
MPNDSIALDDADWGVITDDWWCTPLSLAPYPLSWFDRELNQSRQPHRSEVAARKSHYWHERLLRVVKNVQGAKVCCASCQEWRYVAGGMAGCDAMKEVGVQGDQELNLELVGVKMVLALVDQLERAVGITPTDRPRAGEIASLARRVSLLLNDALPITKPEGFWDEYTASVLDGHRIAPRDAVIFRPDLNADPPPADSITSILDLDLDPPRRKSPRFSREVIDLTDSEQSVASEAPPVTPKPTRSFAAGGGDGTISGDLPKFHIPRVPSSPSFSYSSGSSPLTSDELRSEFSHTRSSSLPPGGDLHKEDYDLESVSESTPSEDAEIPHFLVTSSDRLVKQHSRTREIVDKLRSATVPRGRTKTSTTRGNGNSSTPNKNRRAGLNNATVKQLFQKGSDGWICLADDAEFAASKAKKHGHADRSRNPTEDSELSDSEEAIFATPAPKSTRDTKKKPTQSKHAQAWHASDWVEGSAAAVIPHTVTSGPPRRPHGRRQAQSAQLAAPAPVGTFTFPPPAYYAFPVPPPYAPVPGASFGPPLYCGYPPCGGYPHGSMPFVGAPPHQHQHQHQAPHPHFYMHQPHRTSYPNASIITGSTGIRHAQW